MNTITFTAARSSIHIPDVGRAKPIEPQRVKCPLHRCCDLATHDKLSAGCYASMRQVTFS